MTNYNNKVKYAVFQLPPSEWDHDTIEDQYMYEVIRSFNYGDTWHRYVICLNKEDAEQLAGTLNWTQDHFENQRRKAADDEVKYLNSLVEKDHHDE